MADVEFVEFTRHATRWLRKRRISEETVRAVVAGEEGALDRYDGCGEYYGFDLDRDDRCIKVVVDNRWDPRKVVTAYEVPRRL